VTPTSAGPTEIAQRIGVLDWSSAVADLDNVGIAAMGPILTKGECHDISALYGQTELFCSTIDLGPHRFGEGQYCYFAHPLPQIVAELRAAFWPQLLLIARNWAARLERPAPWPDGLDVWIAQCHDAGQTRPTPLMLRYRSGDWNALHRDLYGDLVFPLQVVTGLDTPGTDYTGGEFVVVEQRPRGQSRATTRTIPQGHGIVFTTRERPIASTTRGWTAAPMRHGVSMLHSGHRYTLGLVFHDAT
jgi:hypothetical protein